MSKTYRVLLVEDEPLITMLYEDILFETKFRLHDVRACNADAIRSLNSSPPDVAIIDYNLPDGVCTPVARRLKELGIPFIVASGYGDIDDPNVGSARWLLKPFSDQQVLTALGEAVADMATSDELL